MDARKSFNEGVDILEMIGTFVKLEPTGSHFTGICPNCNELYPSLNVHHEKGIYECFRCNIRGDAFDFITTVIGFTEEQAMEWLSTANDSGATNGKHPCAAEMNIVGGERKLINPCQDYKGGIGYLGIILRVMVEDRKERRTKVVPLTHIVTSNKDFIRIDDEAALADRRIIPDTEPFAIHKESRWPIALMQKYLAGKVKINPWIISERISAIYDQLLDFPVSDAATVMALWTMGTYVYRIFEAYPYISLCGDKGSGKTKCLQIAQKLCFNSLMSSDISKPSLFRAIEASSATLLIDEAENLKGYKKDDDLIKLLNAGYKRGNPVVRINLNTFEPQSFDVYSPKILAGIRGIDAVLEDRCIVLQMIRSMNAKKANLAVTANVDNWGELRHLLYCFALDHFPGIIRGHEKVIAEIEPGSVIQGRKGELWFPLLGIAKYIDSYGRTNYYSKVKKFAENSINDSEQDSLDNWSISLLLGLEEMFRKRFKEDYENKTLTTDLAGIRRAMSPFVEGDNQKLTPRWIGDQLKRMKLGSKKRRKAGFEYTISFAELKDRKLRYLPNREE